MHIFLEYPQNIAGRIKGYIIGDTETYNRIAEVFDQSDIYLHLSSTPVEDYTQQIYSEAVTVKSVNRVGWPNEYGDCMQSVVAELELNDITIKTKIQGDVAKGRCLIFSLVGPSSFWPVSAFTEFDEVGKFKANVINEIFPIAIDFPAEIKIRPSYSMDSAANNEKMQMITKSIVLEIKINEAQSSLSDKEFTELSTKFADDILILASFASGGWIDWFRRELFTPSEYQIYTKRDTHHYVDKIDRDALFIDPIYAYAFLKIGLNKYRTLRNENFDLYYPLIYFIAGNQAKYLEEKISLFFFSLEKVNNLYSIKNGYEGIVSESMFSDIRNKLLKTVDEKIHDPDRIKWIRKKIPELNRPPIRDIVQEKMFLEYGVEWQDLYPQGADLNIFKVRNELFHTAKRPDIEVLGNAAERIKYIVARLIMKILDWKGRANTPSNHVRNFLNSETK